VRAKPSGKIRGWGWQTPEGGKSFLTVTQYKRGPDDSFYKSSDRSLEAAGII
jgi:hypothetical protein